jgi:hypothetical protein
MVEKFMVDGRHDKCKSWLVAHGNEQDAAIYADWSSLMVAIQSLMTCLAVAACNNECVVGKLAVKGAFIQTELSGIPVYVQCRGKLKELILRVLPNLEKYVGNDSILYCRLKKALYGCVQASKLWNEKLRAFLIRLGYEQLETEPCAFRKIVGNRVYLITVYVDDLLIFATQDELDRIKSVSPKSSDGSDGSWKCTLIFGYAVDIRRRTVKVDMSYYLDKVLQEFTDLKVEVLPGKKNLFALSMDSR